MKKSGKKNGKEIAAESMKIFIVKMTLDGTNSHRTLALPTVINADELTRIALDAFNFDNDHLSKFHSEVLGSSTAMDPTGMEHESFGFQNENSKLWKARLYNIFPSVGSRAKVEYDFGDGWEIMMRRMADMKAAPEPYTCVKTEGVDAMDDCGGSWGLMSIADVAAKWLEKGTDAVEDLEGYENFKWAFCCDDDPESRREEIAKFVACPSCEEITKRIRPL